MNRADGISEIEGKAARVAAGEQGRERVSNSCLRSVSEKNLNLDDHFDSCFSPYPNGKETTKPKRKKKT